MHLESRLLNAFEELKSAKEVEQALNVELGELNQSLEARIAEKPIIWQRRLKKPKQQMWRKHSF